MDDIITLLSHQLQVQRQLEESRAEVLNQIFEVRHHHAKQLEIINKNLKRITMQPVLRPSDLLRIPRRAVGVESQDNQEGTHRERSVVENEDQAVPSPQDTVQLMT